MADIARLGQLFEENRPRLLRMVQRRIDPSIGARIDPEDILTEAFLEARRKWSRFKDQSAMTPYAWLYRIALDSLIAAWRRETRAARDHRQEMPWPDRSSVQLGLSLVASNTSPSKEVLRGELQREVRRVMERLSDRDQEILWMRVFDQLTFREAAIVLNIKENAAAVRYARALRHLRELWIRLHENGRNPA